MRPVGFVAWGSPARSKCKPDNAIETVILRATHEVTAARARGHQRRSLRNRPPPVSLFVDRSARRHHQLSRRLFGAGGNATGNWLHPLRFSGKMVTNLKLLGGIGQAKILKTFTFGQDAVIEVQTRSSTAEFVNFKRSSGLARHIQAFAISVRSEENVIVDIRVDGLGEDWFQRNRRDTVRQMAGARVLEPVLRTLDGIERYLAFATVQRSDC